jgi:hypothetical protein
VTVIPGFPQTLDWLHAAQGAIELADPADAESWIVHDASDGGYGAIVPSVKTDWLEIGTVIGLRTEAATVWRVGVVRRITQDDFGQRRVGIQVLGRFAFPVKVAPADGVASGPLPLAEDAILLAKEPDENGEIALLLGAGGVTLEQHLQVQLREKEYLATPSLIESGRDFVWASLKVTKQS